VNAEMMEKIYVAQHGTWYEIFEAPKDKTVLTAFYNIISIFGKNM
jgi:hypothetical protein